MADGGPVKVDDKLFGLFNAVPFRCLNASLDRPSDGREPGRPENIRKPSFQDIVRSRANKLRLLPSSRVFFPRKVDAKSSLTAGKGWLNPIDRSRASSLSR